MDIKNNATIGYIGLGKMGFNMVVRLLEHDYNVVVYDTNEQAVNTVARKGATGVASLEALIAHLTPPRTIWIMVPHHAVDRALDTVTPLLQQGDTIIDGGNSPYKQSIRRSAMLEQKNIGFLDVGVSGGPSGARRGACLMVGGDKTLYEKYAQLFNSLSTKNGFCHVGTSGAGHFVKMVHNGIEYGMMQAIGEGFEIMKNSSFALDLPLIASLYNHGSVIQSNLIQWLAEAYEKFGNELAKDECCSGEVAHSGEGQWTVETAHELGVSTPVIEQALRFRIESKGNPRYTGQVLSAMRHQFGGHDARPKDSS